MPTQLTLDLPVRPALGREAFFVSGSNALALARLDSWRGWPGRRLMLTGPRGAGKTHLAHVWASETGAALGDAQTLSEETLPELVQGGFIVIEDCHRIAGNPAMETVLFHLLNLSQAENAWLLMTADRPPSRWDLGLPDLKSRLEATDLVSIDPPDDALLTALLVKLFADRQIDVTPGLVNYLVSRMDRSAAAALEIVERLDRAALSLGKPLGKRLARQILEGVLDESGANKA